MPSHSSYLAMGPSGMWAHPMPSLSLYLTMGPSGMWAQLFTYE